MNETNISNVKSIFKDLNGLEFTMFHIGTYFEYSFALDLKNKKICFVNNDLKPLVYDFSQVTKIEIVERSMTFTYNKPRYTDFDISIRKPYQDIQSIDLDISINNPEKIIYSIPFLKSKTDYGSTQYNSAYISCELWVHKFEQSVITKKKDDAFKITFESNLPLTSVADEIQKLKDLLDSGALTIDEFDKQKAKLLNS